MDASSGAACDGSPMAAPARRLRRLAAQLRHRAPAAAAAATVPPASDPDQAGLVGGAVRPEGGPLPLLRADDPPGADALGLSPEEIAQFRELGYVVKRGLIPEADLAPFLDMWWEQPPVRAAGMTPDNPESWVLPGRHWPRENRWGTERNWMMRDEPWPGEDTELVSEQPPRPPACVNSEASAAHTHSNTSSPAVGRLPHKLTADTSSHVWRWHGIGHDEAFVRATSAHPNVLHMAEALLGGPVKRPRRNRGICARPSSYFTPSASLLTAVCARRLCLPEGK